MSLKKLISGISLFLPFICLVSSAGASDQFQTKINITYQFNLDGSSEVTQKYSLTNLTSQTTASAYEFDIYSDIPANLKAYDYQGEIDYKILNNHSDLTRVLIPFNQLSAGKGKTYEFFLTYNGPVVTKVDGLWKISLPNSTISQPGQETTVTLIIPDTYGHPLTLYPATSSFIRNNSQLIYEFSQTSQDSSPGIYAIFGNLTLVGFELAYDDIDKGDSPEIPNDSPGQLVFIQSITPIPENIDVAENGSWTLKYNKHVPQARVKGYLLVEASSSASFPDSGSLSLTNLTSLPEPLPGKPEIVWSKPVQITPFLAFPSHIEITNSGSQAIYHVNIKVDTQNLRLTDIYDQQIPVIPPFGKITLPVKVYTPWIPDSNYYYLAVSAGNTLVTYNVDAYHFLLWYASISIIIVIIFSSLGFIAFYSWGIYFQRFRK